MGSMPSTRTKQNRKGRNSLPKGCDLQSYEVIQCPKDLLPKEESMFSSNTGLECGVKLRGGNPITVTTNEARETLPRNKEG